MLKRKLWSKEEDDALERLLLPQQSGPQWEPVAAQLAALGYAKTAKQCKDRWINNLSPLLNKNKWTCAESQQLFTQYLRSGNKWKNISSIFAGRTDNSVKNQFFSVIRKSLRTMNKFLGINCNTNVINSIRPKVLADLLSQDADNAMRSNLVQKFAFTPYASLVKNIDEHEKDAIADCVQFVVDQNNEYITRKLKPHKIAKLSKSMTTSKTSNAGQTAVNCEILQVSHMEEEDMVSLLPGESPMRVFELEKDVEGDDKSNERIEAKIAELVNFRGSSLESGERDPVLLRQSVIELLSKISEVSLYLKGEVESIINVEDTKSLFNYLSSATKLVDFLQAGSVSQPDEKVPRVLDTSFGPDILGSIHNPDTGSSVAEEDDPIKLTYLPRNYANFVKDPALQLNWGEPGDACFRKGSQVAVCIYDAGLDSGVGGFGQQRMEQRLFCEDLEDMFEDFGCQDSFL